MADDPPYLTVGTEVSAKYKGAFCEAKIRKVVRVVKCKVTFKAGNGSALLTDDQIKGTLRIGATVEAKHPDKNQYIEAVINKIQDCSQYTVVFDDGDITTLRRSALCLKSGRHFNESETLDQLPLTHPEHFSNPVVGGRRGVRRRVADKDESSDEEDDEVPAKKDGKKKYEKELDMGKVVCVESTDKKKSKDTWFPALVVSPSAQETAKIRIKDEYLVRSFRDGRYYTVPKKEITEFTKDSMNKYESNSNVLRTAVDKALLYLEKNELPPHWDREVLFGNARQSESGEGEDQQSESEASEDDPRNEEKDRFIAQLYKFMDDRGTPLNKVPQINNRDIDLHKLFKTVTAKAGYTKVTNQGQWKNVTIKLGCGNMPSTATINLVKQAYKRYLFSFEEFDRKLGYTWTPRSTSTTSKSRSSRSIFRERVTPSSSRESTRESKKGGDDDDSSTASSTKRSDRDTKEKTSAKDKDPKEDEKDKRSASPETDSPAPADTGSETSEAQTKKETVEEPRKSSRGRQPKKDRDAVDEAASPSSSSTASASSRKKRQTNASSVSRERERDSSVASSTKDDGPPTSTPSTKKGTGTGRGKYKRNSAKVVDADEKEKESKDEPKSEDTGDSSGTKKMTDIRLGDKLQVYYPKSEGKTYEAKVIDINEKNESFLVHYTGWNNRYDEWIDRARVSENTTLKLEQSGELDAKGAGGASSSAKDSSKSQGVKPRKGRNSSSATSSTSASSITTTVTTPSGTRSGASKAVVAAPATPTTSSKRRRSTSSEVVHAVPAPKRRRTRQKSGQDSQPSTAASESEPETSDSDGKSIKSEKVVAEIAESKKTSVKDTPVTSHDAKTANIKKNEEKEAAPVAVESTKGEKKQPEIIDLEDELSSSSVTSTKSKDTAKSTLVEDSKESTSSSGSSGQVLDLNQIRLEMKGLEKMVKSGPGVTTQQPSPTSVSVSSPAPPTLSAAVGSSPPPPEPTKVDIYEFQEDGSDETAPPPIIPSAPKLKMFSPAVRSAAVTSEKSSPTVSASSAEAVAKLQLSQDQEKTPVPLVTIEKLEGTSKSVGKAAAGESQNEAPSFKPTASSSPILIAVRDVVKATPVTKEVTVTKPAVVVSSVNASTISGTPKLSTPPVVSISLQSSPSLAPVLAQIVPSTVVLSTPTSAPSLVAVTTATTLTPVIINTTSKTLTKIGAATKVSPLPPSTPIAARISLTSTSSPQSSPPVLVPSSSLTSSPAAQSSTIISTPSVVTLTPVISSAVSGSSTTTISAFTSTSSSAVTSPPPPVLLQQQPIRPLLTTSTGVRPPVITISSPVTTSASTYEKQMLTPVVTATVGLGTIKAIIPTSYTSKKSDLFPHVIQQSSTVDVTTTSSIPTISIISATSLKPSVDSTGDTSKPPQLHAAQVSTVPQPTQISVSQPTQISTVPQPAQISTVPQPTQVSTVPQLTQVATVPQPTQIPTVSQPTQIPTVPQPTQIPTVPQPTQISTVSQPTQIATVPQPTQIPTVPQPSQIPTVPQPAQTSTVPQPVQISTVPQPPHVSTAPQTVQISTVPQPVHISTVPQSVQLSTVPQPIQISTVPQPSQVSTVSQPTQVSTVPQPSLVSTVPQPPPTSTVPQPALIPSVPQPNLVSTVPQSTLVPTVPQPTLVPTVPQPTLASTVSQPAQVSTVPQPVKVAATIPPPPPVVIKQVTSTPTATTVVKPMFGPGPVGITPAPLDTPKQKKKKSKSLGSSTTPVKTLAPLPTSGAPPPPPVHVSMSSTSSVASSVGVTPTPGRKTPVKKRIPPPIDSPGKPVKSIGAPGMPTKPGKMNSEAMNAAIASVGAATTPTLAVPTTVITSTSAIFQGHSGPGGVIFATNSSTPPPPPVSISKTSQLMPIKSSSESIAASIAAVASMGVKSTAPISAKSGMPTKRFMKESSTDKFGMNKDKMFPASSGPSPLSTPPPPPIVIGKATLDSQHTTSQQQPSLQPPPPPITIQAKFQQTHSISGPGIPTGPAVTFVKTTPAVPGGPPSVPHHHSLESHHPRQIHPQPNLPKNPVIFLPSSPIVVKQAFQHPPLQHHTNLQPIIMSKPLSIEGTSSPSVSSSQPTSQPTSVLVTAAPSSMMKSTLLPITVTPSNVQVTSVPVSFASMTASSVGGPSPLSTTTITSHQQQHTPAVELKPVTTTDLPPSITVTKATTVMKSISPDIVAVSSYNSSVRNTSFTPVKPEERSNSKEPEIVVKPAPASAQIVFHTAADTKKVEIIHQQHPPKQLAQQNQPTRPSPVVTPVSKSEPEENSLLCEEIIPGSPTTGEDTEEKPEDEEKEISLKKKVKNEEAVRSTKQSPLHVEPPHVPTPPPPVLPPAVSSEPPLGSGGKPVIVLGPKFGEDVLEEQGFIFKERSAKFGDDDEDDNKLEERSVDSPMGPPSEGREADLQFRDSFSDGADHSPPSSPSTTSTISTDNSSRRHHQNPLSPTPEGGSSKSKDSDDDEDIDSDVGSKSTHIDDADSKHGSTRGSTRIRNQNSRLGRSPSPPTSKRRRMMNRRNKSPEEARYTPRTIRTSSGRKVTPVGRHGESMSEREEKVKQPPPQPLINLAKPPKTGRYNFIPNLNGIQDPDQRIAMISQAINDLKEQYQKTKTEAASFDRRVKRWKRRVREKERLARQEATRAAS